MVIHRSPHSLYIVIYSDILGKERHLRTLFFHACLRRNPVRDKLKTILNVIADNSFR